MRAHRSRTGLTLALVAALCLLVSLVSGPASARTNAATTGTPTAASKFRTPFYGHDRGIRVTGKYVVTESISSGCCAPVSTYTLQLSRAKYGKGGVPVAHVVVIRTHFDKGAYRFPGVKVGSAGTAGIRHGVYEDTVLHVTYCTSKGGASGACGA